MFDTTRLLLIAKLMSRSPLLFRSPMANLPMFADSEDSLSPIFALKSPATIITSFLEMQPISFNSSLKNSSLMSFALSSVGA